MPDKILTDSFFLQHNDADMTGGGGFNSSSPLLPPTPRAFEDPDFPDPFIPTGLANVYWDTDEYFVFDPEDDESDPVQISPRQGEMRWDFDADAAFASDGSGEDATFTRVVPHDGDVRWSFDLQELSAWDALNEIWVPLDLTTSTGGTFIVFLTAPTQVDPGDMSPEITIQRRDGDGVPLIDGDLDVYLYSSDPDMTFYPSSIVTIADGDDGYTFTYTTPNAGDPVITASPEALG